MCMIKPKRLAPLYALGVLLLGCGPTEEGGGGAQERNTIATNMVPDPSFIPRDSANKMIGSYLASVNYPSSPDTLLSWTIDAEAMRKMLEEKKIGQVKIMLAHTLEYINNGGSEVRPVGFSSDALTIVLTGVDSSGNYVYYNNNLVLDRAKRCPPTCVSGTAGNAILTTP